jgi:taurine dioxygenase
LVIWDNRCTNHFAIHDHGDQARRLLRITISDPDPVLGVARR